MFETLAETLPQEWQGLYQLLILPVLWIPSVQAHILAASWTGNYSNFIILKRIFILLPALLVIAGIWISMLGIYTVPFRANRIHFIAALALNWWDALKSIWLFVIGIFRFLFLLFGWFWGLLVMSFRLVVQFIRELILFPFKIGSQFSSKYFQPGVPWLAVILTIFWSALEAGIFTYTLMPLLSEVLSDLVGIETHKFLPPILFMFLFLLISGSFACIQVLTEAIERKQFKAVIQMLLVEFFVMFLEVFFLYRELVDAVTPWIAQHTDESFRMGLYSTLLFSTFGWLGIRGMTWFLFGRYGTPSLLAIMSRQKLHGAEVIEERPKEQEMLWIKKIVETFKNDIEWFKQNGQALAELAILPIVQLLAVAINFCIILVAGQAVFQLPFKSMAEVMSTKEILEKLALKKSKYSK
ncbi:hypothetical protein KAR34_07585 [bacterium]|nr:hypothetical protein [bacterium]